MSFLQAIDVALFRFINGTLSHPLLDAIMPVFAGNAWFVPVLVISGVSALWKGPARARICVLMLLIVLPVGDVWITNTLKDVVARPRPCITLENVNLPMSKERAATRAAEPAKARTRPLGCSNSGSFPSGHTTNWFAATMVTWMYFRRTLRFMLPLACIVGFSRVYNGVHYPSDILGGAVIGAGYAVATVVALDALWRGVGRRLFPLWWPALASLREPVYQPGAAAVNPAEAERHWLRFGYLLIALLLAWRLFFIASGSIQLAEDEAYQWLWSKHLALSYFSKPPLIAYAQWFGTKLWGDNEFGVRFLSPVLAAIGSFVLLRFFARHANARAGFWLIVVINLTPLLVLGSTLLTVDPLLVAFWTFAMLSGWKAVENEVSQNTSPAAPAGNATKWWALTGFWMGLAFLSKYTALLQWLCWIVFFAICKPARVHLRRPGPYLALLINGVCAIPVIVWNARHGWVTTSHLASNANLNDPWRYDPANMLGFLGAAAALMHPVFFVAAVWAAFAMWKNATPLLRYCFAMGAPLFLVYFLFTIHSGVLVNWIAAAVIPMLCVAVLWWERRDREQKRLSRKALAFAVAFGVAAAVFLHDSTHFLDAIDDVARQFSMKPLPEKLNPHRRVRGWEEMARVVERHRRKLEAEGKPVFVIGGHYGTTSVLSFYMPSARTNVTTKPLVYYRALRAPRNQFYFWPSFRGVRTGENALYVQEKETPEPPPPDILKAFESVERIGGFRVGARGRVLHHVQIYACRGLR